MTMADGQQATKDSSPKLSLNPNAAVWTPPSTKYPSKAEGSENGKSKITNQSPIKSFKPSPAAREFVPRFAAAEFVPTTYSSTPAAPAKTPQRAAAPPAVSVTSPKASEAKNSPLPKAVVDQKAPKTPKTPKTPVQADKKPETPKKSATPTHPSTPKNPSTPKRQTTPVIVAKPSTPTPVKQTAKPSAPVEEPMNFTFGDVEEEVSGDESNVTLEKPKDVKPQKVAEVAQPQAEAEAVAEEQAEKEEEEEEELEEGEIREEKKAETFIRYSIQHMLNLRPFRCTCPEAVKNAPCHLSKEVQEENVRGNNKKGKGNKRRGEQAQPQPVEEFIPVPTNEDTRWVPSAQRKARGVELSEDDFTTLIKKAKSILNKLSIEKFDKLSAEFVHIGISNEEILKNVILLILDKAQMEWHFSEMYANLCVLLSNTPLPGLQEEGSSGLFRKILLESCQEEFEKEKSEEEGLEGLSPDDRMEKEMLLKRRTLGHIRFIGELFKQGLLSERILHFCIVHLFGDIDQPDEENIECLCKLFTTVGQKLDLFAKNLRDPQKRQHKQELMETYFEHIEGLSNSKAVSTRLRFMLKDLLDLRSNNWVARRKEEKAKTIAEVREEAERDHIKRSSSNSSLDRRPSSNGMSRSGSQDFRKDPEFGQFIDTSDGDGWETVGGGGNRSGKGRFEKAPTPRRGGGGIGGGPGRPPHLQRNVSAGSNSDRSSGTTPSRRGEAGKASPGGWGKRNSGFKDANGPRRPVVSTTSLKRSESAPNTAASPLPPKAPAATVSTSAPLTKEQVTKKVTSLLEEYFVVNDLTEAVTCVKEIEAPENLRSEMVVIALNIVFEKGDKERAKIPPLLLEIVKENALSKDEVLAAFKDLLEFLEDIEVDIPKVGQYFAGILAPLCVGGVTSVAEIVEILTAFTYSNAKGVKFVADLLAAIQSADSAAFKDQVSDSLVGDLVGLLDAESGASEDTVREILTSKGVEL